MATAWGDESVRKTGVPSPMYLMGACVCDDTETETRQRLALLKPKGARKLHWRDMRPSLRGKVVDAMAAMDIDHVIVAAVPMSQWNTAERARRKCLERLLPLLETEYNVDTLVLERREISQDRNDIRFIDGLRSRRFIGPIRVELCAGETDARLWLPDQFSGLTRHRTSVRIWSCVRVSLGQIWRAHDRARGNGEMEGGVWLWRQCRLAQGAQQAQRARKPARARTVRSSSKR